MLIAPIVNFAAGAVHSLLGSKTPAPAAPANPPQSFEQTLTSLQHLKQTVVSHATGIKLP
jgi:hypothetical protein